MALVGGFSQDPNYEEDAKLLINFLLTANHHIMINGQTQLMLLNRFIKKQGAKKAFNENMDAIKDLISELLREDFEVTSDIPKEMQKLLTFPGEGRDGGKIDGETKNFRIRLIEQEIEFSEKNLTYNIPVEMTAPQSLEKTVSVKVGIVGDSVKSSDKLDIPFSIPKSSLKGKSAELLTKDVIKVDHTKIKSNASRKNKIFICCKTSSIGVNPFNLGLALENPQVLEVH